MDTNNIIEHNARKFNKKQRIYKSKVWRENFFNECYNQTNY